MMLPNKKLAFTLVELLVVIAIIGLIASLSVIALGNARQKSRDSKRVADVKQVQTALELFFSDQGRYPTADEWNTGSLYATGTFGTTTYMERIPAVPIGGTCSNDYSYAPNSTGDDYTINFCLESNTGSLDSGLNFAKAASIGKNPSLLLYYDFEEGSGTILIDKSMYARSGSFLSGSNYYGSGIIGFYGYNNVNSIWRTPVFSLESNDNEKLTISFWSNNSFSSMYQSFFNQGVQSFRDSFVWCFRGANTYSIFCQVTDSAIDGCLDWSSSYNYFLGFDDQWILVSIVFDYQNNNIKYYRNNILVNQYNSSCDITFPSAPYSKQSSYGLDYINFGKTDDFRIYNRGLSLDEISALYNLSH